MNKFKSKLHVPRNVTTQVTSCVDSCFRKEYFKRFFYIYSHVKIWPPIVVQPYPQKSWPVHSWLLPENAPIQFTAFLAKWFWRRFKNSIYFNVKNSIFYCGPTLPSGRMPPDKLHFFFWPICILRRNFLMISLYIILCKTLIPLRLWSNPTLRIMI